MQMHLESVLDIYLFGTLQASYRRNKRIFPIGFNVYEIASQC